MVAKKAAAKKAVPRRKTPLSVDRIAALEKDVATLTWLHTELSNFIKLAIAQQIQQQLAQSPAVQQQILARLNGA